MAIPALSKPGKDASGDDGAIDRRYLVPGLSRGLALLKLFTRDAPEWTLAELAGGLGISRSAAYRLAYTLEKEGVISRERDGRHYRLTAKVLELGFEFFNSQSIVDIAQPHLRDASERTRLSAYLAIRDGWHAVYLAHAAAAVSLVSNLQVGSRQPLHITASGRVLLTGLGDGELRALYDRLKRQCTEACVPGSFKDFHTQVEADRKRGHVFHTSLLDPHMVSCACPVRDGQGKIIAAVTLVGPDHHMSSLGGEQAAARHAADAAAGISRALGFRG